MRLNTVKEQAELGTTFKFYPLSDLHLGSKSCDEKHVRRVIAMIADDPLARWTGVGDFVESIAPDDKRWNPRAMLQEAVDNQHAIGDWYVDRLCDVLTPIMDKCWCITTGNHESKFSARYYTNLMKRVLERFGKEHLYGGWACATNVCFEDDNNHRCSLKVYQQHGWQGGRKDGAKVNALKDLMGFIEGCHIYLVAHSHSRIMVSHTKLGFNQKWDNFQVADCYGAHTGSFLKTYQKDVEGYGERAGYPPVSIGPVCFDVTTSQSGVKVKGIL